MWISTDTLQEPRARKGSDSRFRHSVSLFSWPLASGAAFMDVIINHADKGRLDFHFTLLMALPLPLLMPFSNPFPWHFFPGFCNIPENPISILMPFPWPVTILFAFCVQFVCIIYVPHRRPGQLAKSALPLWEMAEWMGTGQC